SILGPQPGANPNVTARMRPRKPAYLTTIGSHRVTAAALLRRHRHLASPLVFTPPPTRTPRSTALPSARHVAMATFLSSSTPNHHRFASLWILDLTLTNPPQNNLKISQNPHFSLAPTASPPLLSNLLT